MSTYSDLLKSPKWQKKRLDIMNRDKFTCVKCGDNETELHVHHLQYINGNKPWEYDNNDLVTLCKNCHELIETTKDRPGFTYVNFKGIAFKTIEGKTIKLYYLNSETSLGILICNNDYTFCQMICKDDIPKLLEFIKMYNVI